MCKLCDVKADIKLYNPKKNDEIKENYIIIFLTKLSKKYCLDGKFHNFENNKCKYCNYVKNSKTNYSLKNLIDMFNIIEKTKYENNIKVLKIEQLVKKNIKDDNINAILKGFTEKAMMLSIAKLNKFKKLQI